MDKYPPVIQRPVMLNLAGIMRSRDNALRRDECGDWAIHGKKGYIYAVPEGLQFFVCDCSTKWYNTAKEKLTFATCTQDGDSEGGFIMDRLPTTEEAELIRYYCQIPKKRLMSEEELERLRNMGTRFQPRPDRPSSKGAGDNETT
jgi:hypothetical protein